MPQRAILLVRISDDREGEGLGVGRQEADGRTHADRIGWGIAEVIVENDTSAFKRRKVRLSDGSSALRVVRPGLRRSLELLASGDRDGLLAYDLDRYTRDPRDLEDLIDLVEQQRVPVTSVTGSLRLDSDADITMARVMVAVANKSSRDTSRRVARKHEQLAEQGKPGGGGARRFGYERDGITVKKGEADAIKKMAEMVMGGASYYDIANYLNANGPMPVSAERWRERSVQSILTGPRIAGLRVFRGEVVGPAVWPAIIEREAWDELQTAIANHMGHRRRGALTFKRWLNGLLFCGLCDTALVGWSGEYWCATPKGGCGRISIDDELAEAEVERQLLEYLTNPIVLGRLRDTVSESATASVRADVASDEQQLKELAGMWARRELTFAEYQEARAIIAARLEESKSLATSALPGIVRPLLADPAGKWKGLQARDRREVAKAIIPGYTVAPSKKGKKVFDPDRLVLRE
ncbi:recombinase family protein [Kitasatospora sp. NPDC056076]|uniref:recombinase family protein n=1 Tax=Kitasatospora sp. NPDC056076 TaxID=3345703 RepID=UPI0035DE2BC9